jgi:DNA-binding NtrC family response regulator
MAFLEKPITLQKLLKAVELGLAKGLAQNLRGAAGSQWLGGGGSALPSSNGVALVGLDGGGTIMEPELSPEQPFVLDKPLREARDEFEKAYFEFHLSREGGSMTRVADKTGLERTHLYRKLKQLGVDLSKGKKNAS